MKVLLDLNVILDVVLNRQPWVVESTAIWNAHNDGRLNGFLAATEFTNLYYVARRAVGEIAARDAVRACLGTFDVVPVDGQILQDAQHLPGTDFEDNVCVACAAAISADVIVTRDQTGFAHSPVEIVSPADLLARIATVSS